MKKLFVIFIALYSINAFALYTENIPEQCGILADDFLADFTPNTHTCSNGYYLPANSDACHACDVFGKSCPGGTYTFNENIDQGLTIGSYECSSGYYLPANTDACQICTYGHNCPGGTYTFNETMDQGLSIGTYNCNSGSFLPAYAATCAVCPADYTCSGGTYSFNENKYQGATKSSGYITHNLINMCATNALHDLVAVFTPNRHTCLPGYYLPAGVDDCTICPVANKCIGGTYTFNETTTQGIEACPNGTYAPTGSAICYEHILYVGDNMVYLKSDKLTTPSLNIGMNGDIFYANMTTEPTLMNKDSEHYLKLEFNNTVYYVCDDTTCGE